LVKVSNTLYLSKEERSKQVVLRRTKRKGQGLERGERREERENMRPGRIYHFHFGLEKIKVIYGRKL
jgi:hypothetical protein